MPNKTIYVRTEDAELFEQKYSPEWLHDQLNQPDTEQEASPTVTVIPPKPPELSQFRWEQHLNDFGIGYDKVMGDPSMFEERSA